MANLYNTHQVSFPQPNIPFPQRRPSSSPTPSRDLSPPSTPQRRSTGNSPMSSIESIVTQLLVTTKLLLEGLTNWSMRRIAEQQVSDIYMKLGNELNTVIHIFANSGVDMSDLANIPQDLRECLEKALSEEASPSALEAHLPKIRDIIVTLLQGLKAKQAIYRQLQGGYDQTPQTQISMSSLPNVTRSTSVKPTNSTDPRLPPNQGLAPPLIAVKNDLGDTLKNLERRASKRFSAFTQKGSIKARRNRKPSLPEPSTKDYDHEELKDENLPVNPSSLPETAEEDTSTEEKPNVEVPSIDIEVNLESQQKKSLILYLKVGNDVKKIEYDGDISIPALRMLFIEKFQYNPGMDDFPNIYIKDPNIGIFYELEDLSELKDKSVLALNIEALDQVKKHFDQSIANLTKEIREVKKSFSENAEILRRGSAANSVSVPTTPKPSESHFRDLAKMVLVKNKKDKVEDEKNEEKKDALIMKFADDLRGQFDEVQNLRRDLGVMRQFYNGFQSDTKKMIEDLMSQTATVKNVALTKVGTARTFIDAGKAKLDSRTKNLVTKVDELQDIIDELKVDVTTRRSKPRETTVQHVEKESATVSEELASLQEYLKTAKPMWKKTWEKELQMIVDEQKFLNHQEELIEDLDDDNKKLTEVFEQITKVAKMQSTIKPRGYTVKPKEEGSGGMENVLQEVREISPDHEKRIKALENAEKQRERDLASRIDEFELELTNFVAQNKLKKTGGAEEIERLRQKKDEEALKQLFKSGNDNTEEKKDNSAS